MPQTSLTASCVTAKFGDFFTELARVPSLTTPKLLTWQLEGAAAYSFFRLWIYLSSSFVPHHLSPIICLPGLDALPPFIRIHPRTQPNSCTPAPIVTVKMFYRQWRWLISSHATRCGVTSQNMSRMSFETLIGFWPPWPVEGFVITRGGRTAQKNKNNL